MLPLRDLDLGPRNLLSATKWCAVFKKALCSLALFPSACGLLHMEDTVFSVACVSLQGCCTPWPARPHLSGSQEVGLRVYKLLCNKCTARSRTHSQPKLAASRPSHTRGRAPVYLSAPSIGCQSAGHHYSRISSADAR